MKLLVDDAEIVRLTKTTEYNCDPVPQTAADEVFRRLLADRKTLKDAVAMLRVYAKHHLWCRSHRDETQCDCGFKAVKEATNEPKSE